MQTVARSEEGSARNGRLLTLLMREPVLAAVAALAVTAAVYALHVVRGGLTLDDWALAADSRRYHGAAGLSFAGHLYSGHGVLLHGAVARPLQDVYFAWTNAASPGIRGCCSHGHFSSPR